MEEGVYDGEKGKVKRGIFDRPFEMNKWNK